MFVFTRFQAYLLLYASNRIAERRSFLIGPRVNLRVPGKSNSKAQQIFRVYWRSENDRRSDDGPHEPSLCYN